MNPASNWQKSLLAAAAVSLALAGCSTPGTRGGGTASGIVELDALTPARGKEFMALHGTGVQIFQCVTDKQGRYWKFIAPRADLLDAHGSKAVSQGADFTFTDADGSVLTSKIVDYDKHASRHNLRNVLFETKPHHKKGRLTGVRWVKRTQGRGGIPTQACTPQQLGLMIEVPFSAHYTFYR